MFTITLKIPEKINDDAAYTLAEALVDTALASSATREDRKHTNPWVLEWITPEDITAQDVIARVLLQVAAHGIEGVTIDINNLTIEKTPEDVNWLEQAYHDFAPFSIGQFFIYGSHYKEPLPPQQIGLQIDAATAFGSGEHETTKGCMQAMIELKAKGVCPWNILDMGTGSGILAIAAWKLWKAPIVAVDNDEESVRVTDRHAQMNGVALGKASMLTACGDGFKTPIVDQQKPYELILANILAGPVIEMAPELCRVLDENGYCILSGMLVEQADLVTAAYEGEGLRLAKRYDINEWSTLVMHKAR